MWFDDRVTILCLSTACTMLMSSIGLTMSLELESLSCKADALSCCRSWSWGHGFPARSSMWFVSFLSAIFARWTKTKLGLLGSSAMVVSRLRIDFFSQYVSLVIVPIVFCY